MLRVKEYVYASDVEEAYQLLLKNRNNRIIGGMLWLKMMDTTIPCAIDLSRCGLDKIEENENEIRIGAMVTLRELETSESLNNIYGGIISQSVKDIVGVQFRNLATIGGSIYSRFGFSDILTALLCLPVKVVLHHGGEIALSEYVKMPYERDVLTHIVIAKKAVKAAYLSERRSATDFPTLAVAAMKDEAGWHVAIGARPKRAQLIEFSDMKKADAMIDEKVVLESNMRASREYRELLAHELVKRAMNKVEEDCTCE